ncbi:septum formation inhibitor Maf [Devosia epidermidihirudinis]|uniref:Nucleoside triphosphate pyrophosphatase n=1 Tax=Devosia epidermidihirudinis TaxID=1293439 RepID=A0A0F5Q2Q2_9HYPH|nr:Maf family protein [Devosia epidermidihirudinis]KKC35140.1 septum formation inhibitor Maf [Devosia epidermidihirudinis]
MLILASQSTTRKALLEQAGLVFSTAPADLDERAIETAAIEAGGDGRDVALLLAQAKASAIAALHPGAFVIGADQTLALGTELLHKPSSRDDAVAQLDRLAGKTHRLHAAVALVQDGDILWSDIQTAELTMRSFTEAERDDVLDREGDTILSSVGGYRLEGPSIRLFETVSGDYFTILGLPLLPLLEALRSFAPETLARTTP